jgi:hypothetical protein
MRGGKRQGAGAKPGTAKFATALVLRLTPELHKFILSRGGTAWVRELIEKETETK